MKNNYEKKNFTYWNNKKILSNIKNKKNNDVLKNNNSNTESTKKDNKLLKYGLIGTGLVGTGLIAPKLYNTGKKYYKVVDGFADDLLYFKDNTFKRLNREVDGLSDTISDSRIGLEKDLNDFRGSTRDTINTATAPIKQAINRGSAIVNNLTNIERGAADTTRRIAGSVIDSARNTGKKVKKIMGRNKNNPELPSSNDYNLNLDLAEFKRGKDKLPRKRKSMSGVNRSKNSDKLTTYDKLNMPLRAGSVLHQSSREVRSWINVLRDYGLI